MTEEFHQQIGKMLSNLEHNTKLTEIIAKDIGDVKEHLARLNSEVASHEQYLSNLDSRIVEERKERENIKLDMSYAKGAAKFAAALWGTISAIIVGVATHFISK